MDHHSLENEEQASNATLSVAQPSSDNDTTPNQKRSGEDIPEPAAKQARTSAAAKHRNDDDTSSSKSPRHSNSTIAITPLSTHNKKAGPVRRLDGEQASLPPSTIHLPPQVPNVFSFPKRSYTPCQCFRGGGAGPPLSCTGRCISADFLHTYGWEYKALLKETEDLEYRPNDYDDDEDKENVADSFRHLVPSGIVPPLDRRTRTQTDWAGVASINWDCEDYMDRQPDLNSKMRNILVDWIVELAEEYKLSESTFHLALTLVDKSLACTPSDEHGDADGSTGFIVARDMLQCLGWYVFIVCLFVFLFHWIR